MGSAYYETKGKMRGSARDLENMAEVLQGYAEGLKEAYFTDLVIGKEADGEVPFTANGPYGKFDSLNDVDVFRDMAKAAPTASFEASVEGEDSFTQSELHCSLQDGVLRIETNVNNTEDDDRAYLEYITGKLPYDQFIDLYGIEQDSLAEDDYEDFIGDLIIESSEAEKSPFDMDYDDFKDLLESYGGETQLDKEQYEITRDQVEKLGIVSEYEFREEHDNSVTETFTFDAISGNL